MLTTVRVTHNIETGRKFSGFYYFWALGVIIPYSLPFSEKSKRAQKPVK